MQVNVVYYGLCSVTRAIGGESGEKSSEVNRNAAYGQPLVSSPRHQLNELSESEKQNSTGEKRSGMTKRNKKSSNMHI